MMWQRLDGRGTLAMAVQQVVQGVLGGMLPPDKRVREGRVSSNPGALCRARKRMPLEAAEAVCDEVFTKLTAAEPGRGVAVEAVPAGRILDADGAHAVAGGGLPAREPSKGRGTLAGDPGLDGVSGVERFGRAPLLGADVRPARGERTSAHQTDCGTTSQGLRGDGGHPLRRVLGGVGFAARRL